MAIYHCHADIISRAKGRSSVAAAAYRAGDKLTNERDGITHDYTKKDGVIYSEIISPKDAPEWTQNRETLWNEVEKIEKQKNAQLARQIEISLPQELDREKQINLAREYAGKFVDEGMIADMAIHDKGDGNPHAHILLTMRGIENGKFTAKSKKEYLLDKDGKKIRMKSGEYKSKKVDLTDWNTQNALERWRSSWEECANIALERAGFTQRIDKRSYEEQGMEQTPTKHIGVAANEMELRGTATDRGDYNRRVKMENEQIKRLEQEIQALEKSKLEIEPDAVEVITLKPSLEEKKMEIIIKMNAIEKDIGRMSMEKEILMKPYREQAAKEIITEMQQRERDEIAKGFEKLAKEIQVHNEMSILKKFFITVKNDGYNINQKALESRRIALIKRKSYLDTEVTTFVKKSLTERSTGLERRCEQLAINKNRDIGKKLEGLNKSINAARGQHAQLGSKARLLSGVISNIMKVPKLALKAIPTKKQDDSIEKLDGILKMVVKAVNLGAEKNTSLVAKIRENQDVDFSSLLTEIEREAASLKQERGRER